MDINIKRISKFYIQFPILIFFGRQIYFKITMGPKKNKKRNGQDDDEQFIKKQKNVEETLKRLQRKQKNKSNKNDSSSDEQQALANKKQAFNWQLSKENEKALQEAEMRKEKHHKEKQQKEQQAKILTPRQQKQLQHKLQKFRKEKQKKEKKKEQKKEQRQKQLEQQKIEDQRKKQQQEKQAEELQNKIRVPTTNGKCIPIFFLVFMLSLCILQYQRQIYTRLSKFKLESQQNFYETFQIDSGATDRQLKEKYKRLVLKYHPDKNPNCIQCEGKFNQIIKAWEVIGSPEKRKHYDANSGFVTQIKSQSITLTPHNYQSLVQDSISLWIIQVYDSTQKYCHYFSQFWEDVVQHHGAYIKFGRIDVWTQTDMLSYLPYRFQVFPSIYFYHKGEVGMCDFNFQQPDMSVKRCIESQYKQKLVKPVSSIDLIPKSQKSSIVFSQKTSIGTRFKIINKKYEGQFNFYFTGSSSSESEIIAVLPNGEKIVFSVNPKQAQYYLKYQKFLESLIVQKISICEFIQVCENQPCLVLLNNAQGSMANFTIPKQNSDQARPIYKIQDSAFYHALQDLKNKTQMMQSFNLAVYQNGHIDLGYVEEANILNAEEGQSFQQLHCIYKDNSWLGKLKSMAAHIQQMI